MHMEVVLLGSSTLKIKGKKASLVVDPKKGVPKQEAAAILLLNKSEFDPSRVSEHRVIIAEPGEYEVSGIKMSVNTNHRGIFYSLNVDNIDMVLANTSNLSSFTDKITGPKVAILNVDSEFDAEAIAAIEPRVVLLYGENSESAIKSLGKTGVMPSKKISYTSDKLPEETQIVWLA